MLSFSDTHTHTLSLSLDEWATIWECRPVRERLQYSQQAASQIRQFYHSENSRFAGGGSSEDDPRLSGRCGGVLHSRELWSESRGGAPARGATGAVGKELSGGRWRKGNRVTGSGGG